MLMLISLNMYSGLCRHSPLRLSLAVIWGGQDVVVMAVVLGIVGDDLDGGKPLDHPSPDLSGDDDTNGEAVIGLENLAVDLVGDDDVVG